MASSERTDTSAASTASPAAASASASAASTPARSASNEGLSGDSSSGSTSSALDGFRVDCLMNARYHSAREAFLDGVHRWLMFGIIFFGSAAVFDLFEYPFPVVAGAVKAMF